MAFSRRGLVWLVIAATAVAAGAQWGWVQGIVWVMAIAAVGDLIVHQHFRRKGS